MFLLVFSTPRLLQLCSMTSVVFLIMADLMMGCIQFHLFRGFPSTQAKTKQSQAEKLHEYGLYKPRDSHYDKGRKAGDRKDDRRLILLAECQVGKTGAYLHYLQLLARAASTIAVPPPPRLLGDGTWPRNVVSWLLPLWEKLFDKPRLGGTYSRLFASKYTAGIAKKRANLVMQSCKPGEGSWVENFQTLVRNVSGEAIMSEAGNTLIAGLNRGAVAPFDQRGQSTKTPASFESLKAAIDWDGRFHSHGVRLCVCSNQCTPACQQSTTDRSSFGAIPPIRVADLAKTGGQYDAVRARWEASHLEERHGGEQHLPILSHCGPLDLCAQRIQGRLTLSHRTCSVCQ